MLWWDAARIERTVTRPFVSSRLRPENAARLDRAPGFGDGLTDGTYWEWIEDKARRIFLVLDELGIPDQIFSVVDDSWDDDDLPLPLDQTERLTATRDPRLNRRFYDRQFYYVLKEIDEGAHVVYEDEEVVPLDVVVDTRLGVGLHTGSAVDKVALPNQPGRFFTRRRVSISSTPGAAASPEKILSKAQGTKGLRNRHVISYYASYAHQGSLYVLFSGASEYSLKSVLTTMPASLKALSKQERRTLAMNWIHCLADSLCYLHGMRRAHGNIKPSTVLFDADHQPLYADTTCQLGAEGPTPSAEKAAFDKESYDYAAPEQWFRPPAAAAATAMPTGSSYTSTRGAGVPASSPPPSPLFPGGGRPPTTIIEPSAAPPHLDPQAADIFSLGCVALEVLALALKRTPKAFAAHRGARHRIAGRGGAVLDTSFHRNLGQVQSWMAGLAKDAGRKAGRARADAGFFHGVAPTLQLVARMLAPAPAARPPAREVERALYRVLTEHCGVAEPHCVHQYDGLELGLGGLRLAAMVSSSSSSSGAAAVAGGGGFTDDDDDGDSYGIEPIPISTGAKRHSGPSGSSTGDRRATQSLRDSGYHSLPAFTSNQTRASDTRSWLAPVYASNETAPGREANFW